MGWWRKPSGDSTQSNQPREKSYQEKINRGTHHSEDSKRIVEMANKSPKLRETLSTLATRDGNKVANLASPILYALGKCLCTPDTLPYPGLSNDDTVTVMQLRLSVPGGVFSDTVAFVDFGHHEVNFSRPGVDTLKKAFHLNNSEIDLVKKAITLFFGVKER